MEIYTGKQGVSALLKVMNEQQAAKEEKHHHAIEKPSLPWLADHSAKRVC